MSWLNAERCDGALWPKYSPTKGHTDTQTLRQQLGLARKKPEWHRTCHTYFYRFHFNTEKGNAWKLNRCRSRPSDPSPTPATLALFAWQARDYIKLARRQNGRQPRKKGFIMAICLNSRRMLLNSLGSSSMWLFFFYCFSLFFFFFVVRILKHTIISWG